MWARLLTRRLVLGLLTLWLVSVVVFVATQALPGNAALAILGKEATPERVAALSGQLHLDDSLISQYGHWLAGILHGDLGISAAARAPVSELIGTRIANSAFLVIIAGLVAIPLSLALGVWMAIRRDRFVDHAFSTGSLVLAALPEFVIGIGLLLLCSTAVFHVLPAVSLLDEGQYAWQQPEVVVLPAATLILAISPYIARIMRGSMIEVLRTDYVTMARLKGLRERDVVWRHAVPNALVPAIQVSALQLGWMAGSIVVVEFLFSYPGIGTMLVNAVANRDLPMVQALTLLIAAVYVVINLIADLATILVTPKLRTAGR